jgi:hypothetical protein
MLSDRELWEYAIDVVRQISGGDVSPTGKMLLAMMARGDDASIANWNEIAVRVNQFRNAPRA